VEHGERIELAAYVDERGARRITRVFGDISSSDVAPGWEDGWRSFHRSVMAGGVWLGPPWEEAPHDVPSAVIEPGRAFGTGAHPTTRLCLELLAAGARGSLLDIGCGSGVLSIAAMRLGYGPVVAVDDDPVAVEIAAANARANAVEIEVRVADATAAALPPTDVAVANVLLRPVERILERLATPVALTSGYLLGECPAHAGWAHADRVDADGWAADRFERLPA
jgi:ribosomal protein L11 methyltransferase